MKSQMKEKKKKRERDREREWQQVGAWDTMLHVYEPQVAHATLHICNLVLTL